MAKLKNIFFWILGIFLSTFIWAFSGYQQNIERVKSLDIHIDPKSGHHFVTPGMIQNIINAEYPYFDSLALEEINIHLLEETLDNHPSIRKAEVYSKLDGSFRIDIFQKEPIARVQNSGIGFYIDEYGDSMALANHYFAEVPLINGSVNAKTRQKIYHFFTKHATDDFYTRFFSGIQINEKGNWTLFPKPGNHKIFIGKPENIEGKLNKLKKYYQYLGETNQDIHALKTINLNYEGQVICRKH